MWNSIDTNSSHVCKCITIFHMKANVFPHPLVHTVRAALAIQFKHAIWRQQKQIGKKAQVQCGQWNYTRKFAVDFIESASC